MSKITIDIDKELDAILPGETVAIGSTNITIRPLGLIQYTSTVKRIKKLVKTIQAENITFQNFQDLDNLLTIADILSNDFADILSELTNVSIGSLNRLPKEIIVQLVVVSIDVNMRSNETFMGNLRSLTSLIDKVLPPEEKPDKKGKGSQK